ncbi:hypothetical protein M422DRAFT_268320 [Sphaerobolus stellatus SS14]|uniref:Uncharacterized protein n=1 Tax=Sphaerobolus stellatus (strain SS14) TaxID=990650 RepID=A0A0C9U755_SPHS4|nr:hypothetical protein M422DRAFT_268320 [Sphaerobolus stellatus SS14]
MSILDGLYYDLLPTLKSDSKRAEYNRLRSALDKFFPATLDSKSALKHAVTNTPPPPLDSESDLKDSAASARSPAPADSKSDLKKSSESIWLPLFLGEPRLLFIIRLLDFKQKVDRIITPYQPESHLASESASTLNSKFNRNHTRKIPEKDLPSLPDIEENPPKVQTIQSESKNIPADMNPDAPKVSITQTERRKTSDAQIILNKLTLQVDGQMDSAEWTETQEIPNPFSKMLARLSPVSDNYDSADECESSDMTNNDDLLDIALRIQKNQSSAKD